jgi:alkanesulfonate monooxygenase SsuD/methylene tetrahydromethanopterin reductase-like flavin-dependent oxidoreductase (luciferase family)
MTLSIGIAGSTPADGVRRIAAAAEAAGYRALWVNDTPDGNSLDALAVAAEVTTKIGLATGVVPLDRVSVADIAARVRDLPAGRVRLGVGSGAAKKSLGLLERGVEELRARTGTPILIGALGPRTRALAARIADGILFSWLTPELAAAAREQLRQDADGSPAEAVLYARTIASPASRAALEQEAARYAGYPQYAAHFARLGIDPLDTTIDLLRPGSAWAFRTSVDEVVLRIVTPNGDPEEIVSAIHTRAVGPDGPITPGTRDGYYRDTRHSDGAPRYWKLVGGQDFALRGGVWVGEGRYKYGPSWWTLTGEMGIDRIEYADLPPGTPV